MKRSHAALYAGILTAIILTAVGFMTGRFAPDAAAADLSGEEIEKQIVSETGLMDETLQAYAERDAALAAEITQTETAIQTLNDSHAMQVEQVQDEIAQLSTELDAKLTAIRGQEQSLTELQQLLEQDAALQQQKLAELQAQDAALGNQLNSTIGQLQAAYAEIATRQSAQASSSSGGSNSSYEDEDDHEEHEEQEHEDHDDDHGEHGGDDDDD